MCTCVAYCGIAIYCEILPCVSFTVMSAHRKIQLRDLPDFLSLHYVCYSSSDSVEFIKWRPARISFQIEKNQRLCIVFSIHFWTKDHIVYVGVPILYHCKRIKYYYGWIGPRTTQTYVYIFNHDVVDILKVFPNRSGVVSKVIWTKCIKSDICFT